MIRVGVVGAGPWSNMVHAPMFAQRSDTVLSGIWARRPEAADDVARRNNTEAFSSYDEFLDNCDAVSFAVPPDVQAELAISAARAGKALLLEKPLALSLDDARRVFDAANEARVPTQMFLTWRYNENVRQFLRDVGEDQIIGARGHFITGGFLGGVFATPWRLDRGPLLDLGPHVLDLLDASLGPVVSLRAHGDPHRWVGLLLEHESGAVSEVSLTAYAGLDPFRAGVEVYTTTRALDVDTLNPINARTLDNLAGEFVDCVVNNHSHELDVNRGLYLQKLLSLAAQDLD